MSLFLGLLRTYVLLPAVQQRLLFASVSLLTKSASFTGTNPVSRLSPLVVLAVREAQSSFRH